jgi:hypothetical protein
MSSCPSLLRTVAAISSFVDERKWSSAPVRDPPAQGTATFVAANGDQLIASLTWAVQVGPIVSIVEQATITGGTGRFEGASGSFTIWREFNPAAGTTTGSFEGTVSAPGW